MATRLMVSDDLALESQDGSHVVVVNTASAARMKLSFSAYRFLKSFENPRRVDEVVSASVATSDMPQVQMLVDKGMLVDAEAPSPGNQSRLRTAVAYKFCGVPAFSRAAAPDFVILGVPYDLAGGIDCRLAPDLIRRKSLDYSYQLEVGDGRPRGWFDVNRGAWILRGATLADAGDVPREYGEGRERFLERVRRALAQCCTGRTVPVAFGGDLSVTAAVIGGLDHDRTMTVVQITPEPEHGTAQGAGRRLLQMRGVERVISVGAVDDEAGTPRGDELRLVSAARLRQYGPEAIVREWGEELSIYLSIDLGIAADAYMKAAAPGLPLGPTLHEIKALIRAIGMAHRIVGIDLAGLDLRSGRPELTVVVGCQLALAAMSAAYDRV